MITYITICDDETNKKQCTDLHIKLKNMTCFYMHNIYNFVLRINIRYVHASLLYLLSGQRSENLNEGKT
jgi:hypothetical protein